MMNGLNITYKHYTAFNCTVADYVQIFRETGVFDVKLKPWQTVLAIVLGTIFTVCAVIGVWFVVKRKLHLRRIRQDKEANDVQVEKFEEEI